MKTSCLALPTCKGRETRARGTPRKKKADDRQPAVFAAAAPLVTRYPCSALPAHQTCVHGENPAGARPLATVQDLWITQSSP